MPRGAGAGLVSAASSGFAIPAADNPASLANWRRETLSDIDAAPKVMLMLRHNGASQAV
jgi:hypothetical protein